MSASGSLGASARTVLASPERVLVPVIALSVPTIAVHVVAQYLIGLTVSGSAACTRGSGATRLLSHCGPTNARAQLALVVGLFVVFVLAHLVVAGIDRVVLDVVDDVPVRGPFGGWSLWRALPTALLLAALLTASTLFFLLPGLVLGFFTRYAMLVVVDRGLGPLAALGETFRLVGDNLRSELGFVLRAVGVLLLGALALGIGLYVAVPVVLLAQAARYRAARGSADTVG